MRFFNKERLNAMCRWRFKTAKYVLSALPLLLLVIIGGFMYKHYQNEGAAEQSKYDAGYSLYKNYQGQYYAATETPDDNIFSGKVNFVYVKSREGSKHSQFLIIHDEEHRGLLCGNSGTEHTDDFYFACQAVMIVPQLVTPWDYAHVVTSMFDDAPLLSINLKFFDDYFIINGHPLSKQCLFNKSCDKMLGAYAKTKEASETLIKRYNEENKRR